MNFTVVCLRWMSGKRGGGVRGSWSDGCMRFWWERGGGGRDGLIGREEEEGGGGLFVRLRYVWEFVRAVGLVVC